jgi:hypothetical protein
MENTMSPDDSNLLVRHLLVAFVVFALLIGAPFAWLSLSQRSGEQGRVMLAVRSTEPSLPVPY